MADKDVSVIMSIIMVSVDSNEESGFLSGVLQPRDEFGALIIIVDRSQPGAFLRANMLGGGSIIGPEKSEFTNSALKF